MKRKWLAVLCLLTIAALLTGCQGQQNNQVFTEVTQYLGPATDTPVPTETAAADTGNTDTGGGESVFASNPYVVATDESFTAADAMGEEDTQDDGVYDGGDTVVYGQADAAATVYPYAGSSPVPLDPIDAPTPTPRPTLTFTYVQYDIAKLGLSFQGPAGWVPDDSVDGLYTLTEPEDQIKEGQLGVVTLSAAVVSNNYSESELVTEIKQRLDTISATNFTEWKPSYTATRYLMGSKGVYANYSGTMTDGTQVGGRIHAVCLDKVLYCIQVTYPLNYKDDYLNIFAKLRETVKRTGN